MCSFSFVYVCLLITYGFGTKKRFPLHDGHCAAVRARETVEGMGAGAPLSLSLYIYIYVVFMGLEGVDFVN